MECPPCQALYLGARDTAMKEKCASSSWGACCLVKDPEANQVVHGNAQQQTEESALKDSNAVL